MTFSDFFFSFRCACWEPGVSNISSFITLWPLFKILHNIIRYPCESKHTTFLYNKNTFLICLLNRWIVLIEGCLPGKYPCQRTQCDKPAHVDWGVCDCPENTAGMFCEIITIAYDAVPVGMCVLSSWRNTCTHKINVNHDYFHNM